MAGFSGHRHGTPLAGIPHALTKVASEVAYADLARRFLIVWGADQPLKFGLLSLRLRASASSPGLPIHHPRHRPRPSGWVSC